MISEKKTDKPSAKMYLQPQQQILAFTIYSVSKFNERNGGERAAKTTALYSVLTLALFDLMVF